MLGGYGGKSDAGTDDQTQAEDAELGDADGLAGTCVASFRFSVGWGARIYIYIYIYILCRFACAVASLLLSAIC